jgi:hypothetical protein
MRPQRVEVRIEELVLHGFPPLDRRSLGESLERELARRIAEEGLPAGVDVPTLDAGAVALDPRGRARADGEQLAGAVYRALSQSDREGGR